MSPLLSDWAALWGIPDAAIRDLGARLQQCRPVSDDAESRPLFSEEGVTIEYQRQAAARSDLMVFRNNVGALKNDKGHMVRYGLANESKRVNTHLKSADFIGIYRRIITAADVGHVIGQFVSSEMKPEGWRFTGAGRESAQMNWALLIQKYGGIATFYAGGDAFHDLPANI